MRRRRYGLIAIVAGTLISAGAQAQVKDVAADMSRKAERLAPWAAFIDEASRRFSIPRVWIEAVIMTESAGRTTLHGRPITSHAGAMGLMQVMPATYQDMRLTYGLAADPYDPHDNILAGTAYLRAMYYRFGYPGLFGAYNAGPARYAASLQGARLPQETRLYLERLTNSRPDIRPGMAIFVTQKPHIQPAKSTQTSPLFVPLSPQNSAEN